MLQVQVTNKEVKQQALRALKNVRKDGRRSLNLDLIAVALTRKKVDMTKIQAMETNCN